MEEKESRKRHTGSADGFRCAVDGEESRHRDALTSQISEQRLIECSEANVVVTLSRPDPRPVPFKKYMFALLTLALGNVSDIPASLNHATPPSTRQLMLFFACIQGLEWYDFAVYSGLSSIISPLFFPASSTQLQVRGDGETSPCTINESQMMS
jgi:hypothetical protein